MIEAPVERHIEAARRKLREKAWDTPQIEAAWDELALRRANERALVKRATTVGGTVLALAAAVALAVVALRALRPGPEPATLRSVTSTAALERLALGEGSEAIFRPGVELDVREQSNSRVVVAIGRGAAQFRVRHDPERLFRVEAGDVVIEDRGTEFQVERGKGSVRVSVTEGSVEVSFSKTAQGTREVASLRAGESGVYPTGVARSPAEATLDSKASGAPAPGASSEAGRGAPPQAPSGDWRELARVGKHKRAYELIAPNGFRDVRDEPADLLLASDVARLSRHPAESAVLLRKLLANHSRDSRAPSAAFTLGWVLMKELRRPREAATAFARAEALAPRGNLAEDAMARAVEAWYQAGDHARAKTEVERYKKSYPRGRHRAMLERLFVAP